MAIAMDNIANMPAFSPYYPMPPARYRNVKLQFVYFRADLTAIDRVLPECLEPSDDGFCAAIGLTVPWSANYGQFQESLLVVRCLFEGQLGYFAPVVFLNSRGSIPAGREIYGTPKVFAEIDVGYDIGRVDFQGPAVGGGGLVQPPLVLARQAEVVMGLDETWIERHGGLEGGLGLGHVALRLQRRA